MLPDKGELSPDQLDLVRTRFAEFSRQHNLSLAQVAKEISVASSTLSQFAAGKYAGNNERVARTIDRWIETRSDSHRAGLPAHYVTTTVADRMLAVVREVKATGTMGVIVGPSGISKTTVFKAACSLIPGALHIELCITESSPGALLRTLCSLIGCGGSSKTAAARQRDLIEELAGSQRLLIIDEAHFLGKAACIVLRDIHKQTGCPIVLGGTRDVLGTVNDFTEFSGQFHRLISYSYDVTAEQNESGTPLYTVDEIVRFAKSMGLRLTGDAAEYLTELSSVLGWGGLGKASMLLLNARTIARGESLITLRHLQIALRSLSTPQQMEAVALRSRKVKVA